MADKQSVQKASIGAGSLLLIALIVWFFSPDDEETHKRLQAVQSEVKALRASVDRLAESLEAQRAVAGRQLAADPASGRGEAGGPAAGTAGRPDPAASHAGAAPASEQAKPGADSLPAAAPFDPSALQVERADEADPAE